MERGIKKTEPQRLENVRISIMQDGNLKYTVSFDIEILNQE